MFRVTTLNRDNPDAGWEGLWHAAEVTITAERPTAAPRVRAVGLPRWAVALRIGLGDGHRVHGVDLRGPLDVAGPLGVRAHPAGAAILVLSWVSIAAAFGVGLWLWARAAATPPVAGCGWRRWPAAWFIGTSPPSPRSTRWWSARLELPAPAMALLGFPAGRPSAWGRRWILVAALGATLAGAVGAVPVGHVPPGLATGHVALAGGLGRPAGGSVRHGCSGVVPAVAAAGGAGPPATTLASQRGPSPHVDGHPPAGWRWPCSEVVALATFNLGSAVLYEPGDHPAAGLPGGPRRPARSPAPGGCGRAGRAFVRRPARWVLSGRLELDLGRSGPIAAPSESLRHLVEDPTARVLFVHPDGSWFDEARAAAAWQAGAASTVRSTTATSRWPPSISARRSLCPRRWWRSRRAP